MGTSVLGAVNLAIEQVGGEQALMPYTAIAPTMSLVTAPSGPQGMRLHGYVKDNTTTGTITITGLDINGGAITETIPPTGVIPIAPVGAQNSEVGRFEWESTNVFGSTTNPVNAITTTGLTGGSLKVGGTYGGKFLVPCDLEFTYHDEQHSPNEFRASYDTDFVIQQLRRIATVDKFMQDLYPETSLWLLYLMIASNPVVTTLPATPTVLKASTPVATTPQSLTTQPLLPGQKLQFVLTAVGAAGTIAITGTDVFGNAQTETIVVPNVASQTLYSAKVYQTIGANGVVYTGMTGGSAAINGVYGFQWTALPGPATATLTAVLEFFTGTDSGVLPFVALEDAELDWAIDKVASLTSKAIAQDWLPIGDRTTLNLATNRITSLGVPTDIPLTGTQSQVWLDPISGTPQTTLYGDLLSAKVKWQWPVVAKWTSTISPVMNRIYRKKRALLIDLVVDMTNQLQAEKYRRNEIQYWAFQLLGQPIGGGNNKGITIITPAKITDFKRKHGVDKENVEADISLKAIYDPGIGAVQKIIWVNTTPPTYLL